MTDTTVAKLVRKAERKAVRRMRKDLRNLDASPRVTVID